MKNKYESYLIKHDDIAVELKLYSDVMDNHNTKIEISMDCGDALSLTDVGDIVGILNKGLKVLSSLPLITIDRGLFTYDKVSENG